MSRTQLRRHFRRLATAVAGVIRVIYYDVNDPFWGAKLIEKIAENILSTLTNPEEAIFKTDAADE